MSEIKQFQRQTQSQKQIQKLSQKQIQAVTFIQMSSKDLYEEIKKFAEENPALEIVKDPFLVRAADDKFRSSDSDKRRAMMEAVEDNRETLRSHLMNQLNLISGLKIDEYEVCQKLIANLDKDGFYGSSIAPESLLDGTRPVQNKTLLNKCIKLIQQFDPVGTCCKDVFESLKVQAEITGDASPLTMFLLDGHLDLLQAPSFDRMLKNIKKYQKDWHSKSFASELLIDKLDLTEEMVQESLIFIRQLNPHPASEFAYDGSGFQIELPDVVVTVEKKEGSLSSDDIANGRITADNRSYFQIKYASGVLPEVRVVDNGIYSKAQVTAARDFYENLMYRESSMILQCCSIVQNQKDFFLKGPGNILPLTRRQVANQIGVHESTVSRFSAKHNSKFIQTEWGVYPASYFFSSGVEGEDGNKVSAEAIKTKMSEIIAQNPQMKISDSKMCDLLNEKGIKIARRTVAKYRSQLGINNSYQR